MKIFFLRCLRYASILVLVMIISFALLISVAAMCAPLLEKYHAAIAHWISQQLSVTVNFDRMQLGWRIYQPVIKFTKVTVRQPVLNQWMNVRIKTMRVSCAIWQSIVHRQFVFKHVVAEDLAVYLLSQHEGKQQAVHFTANKVMVTPLGEQTFAFRSRQARLQANQVFIRPLMVKQLDGQIQFNKLDATRWQVMLPALIAHNGELSCRIKGNILLTRDASPLVNIVGQFIVPRASDIIHYLPLRQFDLALTQWLQQALIGGRIEAGSFILRGKLADFPFVKDNGKWFITGVLKQLGLRFSAFWPVLEQVNGQLTFMGSRMQAHIDRAMLRDLPITHLVGIIPAIDNVPVLSIQADPIRVDSQQGIAWIAHTPLHAPLEASLQAMQLTGPVQLALALTVPLTHVANTAVQGQLRLDDVQLRLPEWHVLLEHLQGQLIFTQHSLKATGISGRLFAKPITLALQAQYQQSSALNVQLTHELAVDDVQKWLAIPLDRLIQGTTKVNTQLTLRDGQLTRMQLHSSLQGVTVTLPGQYGKSSVAATRPLQVDIAVMAKHVAQVQARYGDLTAEAVPRVPDSPDSGWHVAVKDHNIAGVVLVPDQPDEPVSIQLQHLRLDGLTATPAKAVAPIHLTLPRPVMLRADDVQYQGTTWGKLQVYLVPHAQALVIQRATLSSPFVSLQVNGQARLANQQPEWQFVGTLQTQKASQLLAMLGWPIHNVILGHGAVMFNLHWRGSIVPTMAQMRGHATLSLQRGRILKLDQSSQAGIWLGQLLNILSLQTIPRRLSLDFSDILQSGYSFDVVKGDFDFADSIIYTKQASIEGPVATVQMNGEINARAKNYDLVLSVTPHVTASLPVAAALVTGQPVVGLATWVVGQLVSSQLSKVTTYYYTITGPWQNPTWLAMQAGKNK